ncbi:MAG: hypothetical protein B7W98_00915 [Parcubacteria group bacterium 20-58-5]|nr:MAG: hypothetical protein B7W98_00915 [Parcubacteria group bacterium 20-58-5]OYV63733.1 MAG: hypothetical protein B7X03_00635 [Parcubacteria group bacterium 21-58-10]
MEKPNHHEHPELWFRPSPAMPLSVLLSLIESEHMTVTPRLGKRDATHPKGYQPGTVATIRLFDEDWKERLSKRVRITGITSKPLRAFADEPSLQEELSFFEGRPITPDETVSFVEFSYLNREDV